MNSKLWVHLNYYDKVPQTEERCVRAFGNVNLTRSATIQTDQFDIELVIQTSVWI